MKLLYITDEDAIKAAKIAKITENISIERSGNRVDQDFITITETRKDKSTRSIRIYFNGSNTRCLDRGIEVIEYCYKIYDFLNKKEYTW